MGDIEKLNTRGRIEALLKLVNDWFRLEELALTWSEDDPRKGSENHVLLTDGEHVWHFPDVETVASVLEVARGVAFLPEVLQVLSVAEECAVSGWFVNGLGGGETFIGEETRGQWAAAWRACGLDPEECSRLYLQPMKPEDWRFPRL